MCKECATCNNEFKNDICEECYEYSRWVQSEETCFCRYCGRPLTEKAWKILKKRFENFK